MAELMAEDNDTASNADHYNVYEDVAGNVAGMKESSAATAEL